MKTNNRNSFYSFSAQSLDGNMVDMNEFTGKVILIVNTASECGFTPQYEGLQKLYEAYHERGFVVLGFPCNQFGGQEPGDAQQIKGECLINYGVTFPMFEKINVNGKESHPIFTWLKEQKSGLLGRRIKWNFTKFLIDRQGKVVDRYASTTKPESLDDEILKLLDKSQF